MNGPHCMKTFSGAIFRIIFHLFFLHRSSSSSGWMTKSNNFSQFKYKTGGQARSSGPARSQAGSSTGAKRGDGLSGPGMMPVPMPKRSFLSTGGNFMG